MRLICNLFIIGLFLCTLICSSLCADISNKYELCSPKDMLQCKNGGTCLKNPFGSTKVFCLCSKHYEGNQCELDIRKKHLKIFGKHDTQENSNLIYDCQDVGYKLLTCKNNGTCIVVDYGTKNQSALCVCARGYYGQQCEYNGKIVQKFKMPTTAWTVQGDSNYLYITLQHQCGLVAYKLNSSGLIIGADYKTSVNTTVQIGTYRCDHMATTMSADKQTLIVTDFYHTIVKVQTNPLMLEDGNITLSYAPGGVAIDSYKFLWVTQYNPGTPQLEVFDKDGNVVANLTLTIEVNVPSFVSNCGILVKPIDQLFVADWSTLLIYQIGRDENHIPTNLTMISKTPFIYSPTDSFALEGFNYDKWGNVLMSHEPQIEIWMSNNQLSKIIPPEDKVFWRATWTDPDTGYAFIVGDSSNLYVIDYSDLVI